MDAIGPPPTAAPTAAPVPAPTSSDCEAHPENPITEASAATAIVDLSMFLLRWWNKKSNEAITAAVPATVGIELLPPVTSCFLQLRAPQVCASGARGRGNSSGCQAPDDLAVARCPNGARPLRHRGTIRKGSALP